MELQLAEAFPEDLIIPVELWECCDPTTSENEVEVLQTREDGIREAQEAWTHLNACLHYLGPLPPEVLEGWDRIKPWLNEQARDVRHCLEYVRQRQSDVVCSWS